MIGMISSSRASFVTSPPRRSILFPTSMTGTWGTIRGAGWGSNRTDIDTQLAEMRKPKRRYAVEGIWVIDGVYDTYDVCFPDL